MLRFDRLRFAAFGLPALVNALLLPGYALMVGPAADGPGVPVYLGLGVVCLVLAVACVVKRGRDLGWSPLATVAGGVLSFAVIPAPLFALGTLLFTGSNPEVEGYGPPPPPPTAELWLGAGAVLCGPWILLQLGRLLS